MSYFRGAVRGVERGCCRLLRPRHPVGVEYEVAYSVGARDAETAAAARGPCERQGITAELSFNDSDDVGYVDCVGLCAIVMMEFKLAPTKGRASVLFCESFSDWRTLSVRC